MGGFAGGNVVGEFARGDAVGEFARGGLIFWQKFGIIGGVKEEFMTDTVKTGAEGANGNNANTGVSVAKNGGAGVNPSGAQAPWRTYVPLILSICAVVLGAVGCVMGVMAWRGQSSPLTFLSSGMDSNSANFQEGSIAEVAEKVSPSVVSIVTSSNTSDWFGRSVESEAAGTGIIVSADGLILTNKHVVSGANNINIVLDDGTTYQNVEIVATDPNNDIAFLKIKDVSDLVPATLGDSKTLQVGQQVMAIGNAMGLYQNTVTVGVISGLGRSVTASDGTGQMTETLTDMIQTDAAINSGNSGGPLVNAAGQVIGVNTATSSTAENMGFAIPISAVKGMLSQLTSGQNAARAYLGVYTLTITPDIAKEYDLPVKEGAYVFSGQGQQAVIADSPAAKAGIKEKDIIVSVNGVKIGESGSLPNLIAEYKPGDTVKLGIIRDGQASTVDVKLEEYKK